MIACVPGRRICYQEKSGYTVMLYRAVSGVPAWASCGQEAGMECFKAVGLQLPDAEGIRVELEGEWKDGKHGWQFHVDSFRMELPKTREGIAGYLAGGFVKGVGPVTAGRIADMFGEDTFRVIEEEPERLLAVKGVSPARLQEITASFAQNRQLAELAAFLAPYRVTVGKVKKIQEHFGGRALSILQKDPYRLTEITGMGFLTVDPIARRTGSLADNAPERIRAVIRHVLKVAETEGHLYLKAGNVVARSMSLFANLHTPVKEREVRDAGNRMVQERKALCASGDAVYLHRNFMDEWAAAGDIVRLMAGKCPACPVDRLLAVAQERSGIKLGKRQEEAVRNAFLYPVSIITGGAGRGKTTTLRVILWLFKAAFPDQDVLLCAPTGRAARRMMESTGHAAMTVHKGLYLTEEGTEQDRAEPVKEDMVIVDEMIMVDMHLAATLFSRLACGTRLVLVGDTGQLPSVGPGNVLKELIACKKIPATELDVGYRQEAKSLIAGNADLINAGKTGLKFGKGFSFVHADSPEEAKREILRIYQEAAAREGSQDAVQVLSPVRKYPHAGTEALNRALQELANPDRGGMYMEHGGAVYRIGDRVMQMKNQGEISNGDIGVVEDIWRGKEGQTGLSVRFPDGRRQSYGKDEPGLLEHAWAVTVHKSQGSEYPVVILPVLPAFYRMMRRNVLYTAVTRASREVFLVGSTSSLVHAIHKNDVEKRNTMLAERICALLEGVDHMPAA